MRRRWFLAGLLVAAALSPAHAVVGVPRATLLGANSVVYDTDAQAYFNACATAGSAVSTADKGYINTFILAMKADSLWSLLDRCALLAAASSTQALIDLKSLTVLSNVNSATFAAYGGFTGNGTSSYIDLNFTPSSGTPQWAIGSASVAVYDRTTRTGAIGAIVGQASVPAGQNVELYPRYTDNTAYFKLNTGSTEFSAANTGATNGFWHISRTSTTVANAYRNGSLFTGPAGGTAVAVPVFSIIVGGSSAGGEMSTDQWAFALAGAGFTSTQAANAYAHVQALGTSMGWSV